MDYLLPLIYHMANMYNQPWSCRVHLGTAWEMSIPLNDLSAKCIMILWINTSSDWNIITGISCMVIHSIIRPWCHHQNLEQFPLKCVFWEGSPGEFMDVATGHADLLRNHVPYQQCSRHTVSVEGKYQHSYKKTFLLITSDYCINCIFFLHEYRLYYQKPFSKCPNLCCRLNFNFFIQSMF